MRSVLFVINELETLQPTQSTAALIAALADAGHTAWVCGTDELSLSPGGVVALARRWSGSVSATRSAPRAAVPAGDLDAVWVRTNPGRSTSGQAWIQLLFQLEDAGVHVRNAPSGLLRAASKLHLGSLPPQAVPPTWASSDPAWLGGVLDAQGQTMVLKPALGTRGAGVVRLQPGAPGQAAQLAAATASGPALLQAYIPDAPAGDIRLHVVAGELFEVDGEVCAVARVPASGEWRSNVALGGTPTRAAVSDAHRALVASVGPVLRAHGLWHVGLDVVGGLVVECNVFSPGGLTDAAAFTGAPFVAALVERFLSTLR